MKNIISALSSVFLNLRLSHITAKISLGIIFIIALTIRIYPVLNSPEESRHGFGPYGDTFLYHTIAYNLYKGNGFSGTSSVEALGLGHTDKSLTYEPAITRGPVYPFFICMVYKLFGSARDMQSIENWHNNWDKVRLAQCVVDSLVCIFVFFLARIIYPRSYAPALIAAFLYCFSFYNIFYTKALLSESITTFLVTASLLLFVAWIKNRNLYILAASGMGFGLSALCRTEYQYFPLFILSYILFLKRKDFSGGLKKAAVFMLAALLTIAPWTLRNYMIFKKPILVSINATGYNSFLGTYEGKGNWNSWNEMPDSAFSSKEEKDKAQSIYYSLKIFLSQGSIKSKELDDKFFRLTIKRVCNAPLKCLKSWIMKIPRLWYQFYIPMYKHKEASGNFFIFYFIFALYFLCKSTKEEKVLMLPVWLLFVFLTLLFMPFHIEPRYGVIAMPGIICLTAIGIWKLVQDIRIAGHI